MDNTNRTALILGATGKIGSAVAAALLARGWTVRALARNMPNDQNTIDWIQGDAMVETDVVRAARGASVIFHGVNPPGYRNWDTLVLPMLDNSIAAAREAGGARIVLPGTVYNYDPARTPVIDANTPQTARSRKGRIRVEMERRLKAAAPEVPSLILRAGDFFGPGARTTWFGDAMIRAGKPVARITSIAPGVPHAYAYLLDLAETFALLLDLDDLRPAECLQFAGTWDADGTQMRDAIGRVVGRAVPERAFPWWALRLLSLFGGFAREVVEMEPVWRYPMRLDDTRLKALLGTVPATPLDDAIRASLADLGCRPVDRPKGPMSLFSAV